jgi:hypothetical protein
VLEAGPTHPPFFAWIGPHAPHLPSTPAPWYTDHPVGLHTAPRDTPYYNYSALDHHEILANQPIINDADARAIDAEYAKRLRSLLSVDDIVVALHELLTKHNEWHNTFLFVSSTSHLSVLATLVPNTAAVCVLHFCTLFVCAACTLLFVKGILTFSSNQFTSDHLTFSSNQFTSDHGYSQGQYRLCSHKMQVYITSDAHFAFLANILRRAPLRSTTTTSECPCWVSEHLK